VFEEILSDLYRIVVPLPGSPLGTVNAYVIKARESSLIIDTGMNTEECMKAMCSGLEELGVDLKRADFFITHFHTDHLGLVSSLATDTSKVYFNEPEAAVIRSSLKSGNYWDETSNFARLNGFPEDELKKAIRNHPGVKYGLRDYPDFHILKEGDTLSIGSYSFNCLETPGHSMGHMCLHEPNEKILVAGDHILIDITPNISMFSNNGDPLAEYLKSLDKVYDLDIELVLPGHRNTFKNYRKRIEELKHHHEERAVEVVTILEKGDKNAFEVASQMSWDIPYECWGLFPPSQKWFATGEVIAHLIYLEGKGKVRRETRRQRTVFSLR